MLRNILYTAAVVLLFSSCKKDYDDGVIPTPVDPNAPGLIEWNKAADSSTNALIQKFWNPSGNFFNEKNTNTNFNYWHALAMLRAFDAANDAKYRTAVEAVWADIKTGWNTTMGGGIAWRKSQMYYKNTPANAPAAILAVRLYDRFKNPDDLAWSKKIYAWLKETLYNKSTGWVYDGINSDNDGKRNESWKFTYNQGTFIGAAIGLFRTTNEAVYLSDALQAANFTLSDNSLTNFDDNLLKDEGGGDGGLFKGVFVRYFTELILTEGMLSSDRARYIRYLRNNATTLWNVGTDKNNLLFASYWKNKAGASTDLTIQLSGAILMEAAALLDKEGYFDN
ncbi:MAG: glycosyl hydrolase family 76 [Chitinophagaceae bacterium]|nr:MAG: glycosyl hydrolase family 76 [Chitinophagaceae bacterium]